MLRIKEPFHGAVLNWRHGRKVGGSLIFRVRGQRGLRDSVTVNGQPAQLAGDGFFCDVTLKEKETDIVASASGPRGLSEHRVRVVWDRHSRPRYRFTIDDNSFVKLTRKETAAMRELVETVRRRG